MGRLSYAPLTHCCDGVTLEASFQSGFNVKEDDETSMMFGVFVSGWLRGASIKSMVLRVYTVYTFQISRSSEASLRNCTTPLGLGQHARTTLYSLQVMREWAFLDEDVPDDTVPKNCQARPRATPSLGPHDPRSLILLSRAISTVGETRVCLF